MLKRIRSLAILSFVVVSTLVLSGCSCIAGLADLLEEIDSEAGSSLPPATRPPPSSPAPAAQAKEPAPDLRNVKPPGPPSPLTGTRIINTGTINTGTVSQMGSETVDGQGAELTFQAPGHPLSGMTVTVPAGAYKNNTTFKVSSAPITGNTFKNVTPASPLITIDNGGAYAAEPMKVKVPVKVPAGSFAMGFYYDAKAGRLEGMPLLSADADSVTVESMHFSSFFVSLIDAALLKADIDSQFRPGIDDWQFTNYGSYIAPGGHCAGQTLTALWYYVTQPDGKDLVLYSRYDKNGQKPATPDLWQDDNLGFRFASVIQKDINWTNFETKFFVELTGADPELTWRAFAYAIRVTGEPQFVGIVSNAGGGHAMIVYRIKDGNLYIADPNYPGNNDRRIEYVNKQFKPYNSGANAEEIAAGNGKNYERIGYVAKSAFFDWNRITARWQEFKAGTIGNGIFPNYRVIYADEKGQVQDLKDGTVVTNKMLELETRVTGAASNTWGVYRDGVEIKHNNWKYELKPGENLLGIAVFGKISNKQKYVDFTYRKVVYQAEAVGTVSISPATWTGEELQEQVFTVSSSKPPAKAYYEWFNDGTSLRSGFEKTLKFSWPYAGTYTLTVKESDASVNPYRPTGTGTAQITIKPKTVNHLKDLQAIPGIKVGINVPQTYSVTDYVNKTTTTKTSDNQLTVMVWEPGTNSAMTIKWNGTSFSGRLDYGVEKTGGNFRIDEITGTVSPDGMTLLSMTYKYRLGNGSSSNGISMLTTWTISLRDFPLYTPGASPASGLVNGAAAQKYVATLESNFQEFGGSTLRRESTLTKLDWNGKNVALGVTFMPFAMTR